VPLVLSERDYKVVTLFAKVAGIFLFAAGSVVLVDQQRVWLGLALIAAGSIVTLAPVPMTVVMPESVDEAERAERDGELSLDARM
jgi:Na+/melibiose symporter-like transporter